MPLQDQVALITGAASGIGQEIARCFARAGVKVCIADLNLAAATATAEAIKREFGPPTLAVAMDVADEAQVESGVKPTESKVIAITGTPPFRA